jgi:hypothetical protein
MPSDRGLSETKINEIIAAKVEEWSNHKAELTNSESSSSD